MKQILVKNIKTQVAMLLATITTEKKFSNLPITRQHKIFFTLLASYRSTSGRYKGKRLMYDTNIWNEMNTVQK